jgi:hypothetical protein
MSSVPFALALALASTTVAQVAPGGSPAPSPAASAQVLPEIGRVRASSAACAAVRDIVVPSILAVRRGDARYRDVAQRLHRYVQIVDEKSYSDMPVYRQGALGQLDVDTIALKREVLAMDRALGDPRISQEAAAKDPAIASLRVALVQLFNTQSTRANLLQEYVTREHVGANKTDFPVDTFGGKVAPVTTPAPVPGFTPPPAGMPQFHGVGFADGEEIDKWTRGADAYARGPEYSAARKFATVAERCR